MLAARGWASRHAAGRRHEMRGAKRGWRRKRSLALNPTTGMLPARVYARHAADVGGGRGRGWQRERQATPSKRSGILAQHRMAVTGGGGTLAAAALKRRQHLQVQPHGERERAGICTRPDTSGAAHAPASGVCWACARKPRRAAASAWRMAVIGGGGTLAAAAPKTTPGTSKPTRTRTLSAPPQRGPPPGTRGDRCAPEQSVPMTTSGAKAT